MKRRLLIQKIDAMREEEEKNKEKEKADVEKARGGPKEVLKKIFVGRAWEVWHAAESQYPQVTKEISVALASLVKAGRIRGKITGEQLYWFLRRVGLRVRLKTQIRIYESGELKTIADKLKE